MGTCKGRIPKVALARGVLPLGDNVQRDFFPSFGIIGKVLAPFGPCDGVWMQHWDTMLHGASQPQPPLSCGQQGLGTRGSVKKLLLQRCRKNSS